MMHAALALILVTDRIAETHRQVARERMAEHARRAAMRSGRRPRRTATTLLAALALGLALAVAAAGSALGAGPSGSALVGPGAIGPVGVVTNDGPEPTPPSKAEPKPKHHPKDQPPADGEQDPPGPGDRITVPSSLNMFASAGFRYQDPNYYACTATSVMDMLNFVKIGGTGGTGFRWEVRLGSAARDSILAWERTHDTLAGGNGSDPHGWRNALNYYGWGSATLYTSARVYEDYAFSSYERAVKAAVRAMIRYHKPVGLAAWRGTHAHMLTGYDGLVGDPFAVDAAGKYTNAFTIAAVYLTDPLVSSAVVNKRITYTTLGTTSNTRIRFQPYYETDSPYDDPYTSGWVRARDEWYGRWVIVAPKR
jgi:hypothetical protein